MGEMNQYDSFVTYKFPALSSWISRACPDLCSPPVSLRCTLDSLVSSLWRYLELSQYALQHRCLFRSVSHPSIYLHWIQWDSSAHKFTVQQLMIVSLLNLLVMVLNESINTQKIREKACFWLKKNPKQTNKHMYAYKFVSTMSVCLPVSIVHPPVCLYPDDLYSRRPMPSVCLSVQLSIYPMRLYICLPS